MLLSWVMYAALVQKAVVPGWASLLIVQGVFSGFTLIAVGLLGDYVGRIYDETKGRPLYVIGRTQNLETAELRIPRGLLIHRGKRP